LWLHDHLDADPSLAALARQINSPACQGRTSEPPPQTTVEAVRLESACDLPETTNSSIEQVAKTDGMTGCTAHRHDRGSRHDSVLAARLSTT
jgi:transcriptional regulator GlxA family with amidase domain